MSEKFNSFIRFNEYKVNNIFFKINKEYKNDRDISVDTKFSIDHNFLSENKDRIEVTIACELFNENFEKYEAPFYLNTSITGEFDINYDILARDQVPEEIVENIMEANTLAILFPYVRSTITSITSAANVTPVILPPVNTNRLLESDQD